MNKVFQKVSLNLSLRDTSWGDEGCAITWTFIPVPSSDWKCKSLITLWDKRKSCRKHQGSQTCWACNIITPCISTMFISSSSCLNIFIPSLLHGREISTICRRDSSLSRKRSEPRNSLQVGRWQAATRDVHSLHLNETLRISRGWQETPMCQNWEISRQQTQHNTSEGKIKVRRMIKQKKTPRCLF